MAKTYAVAHPCLATMLDGTPPVYWTLPAKANAVAGVPDFVVGSFVYRTGGYLNIATNATVALGLAMQDCEDAIADIEVLVFTEMTGIAITVCADAAEAAHVLVDTNQGVAYDWAVTSKRFTLDVGNAGTSQMWIQKLINNLGDTHARVVATVLPAYREVS